MYCLFLVWDVCLFEILFFGIGILFFFVVVFVDIEVDIWFLFMEELDGEFVLEVDEEGEDDCGCLVIVVEEVELKK